VPLPQAAAGHQLANARALLTAGAAVLIEQRFLTSTALVGEVKALLDDPARMALLRGAMLRRAHPNAAVEIAREALELIA
jgi:UDP-N-acetylglucosamine--N-acetylmuramyl-(pentapeptide) pyrophosphoryl-undecaprenol N-acetylglucosamine transferase